MKNEMENQQTRRMKRENPTIEICPDITRRTVANGRTMYQMIATLARSNCLAQLSSTRSWPCPEAPSTKSRSKTLNPQQMSLCCDKGRNQPMKPPDPWRSNYSELATDPTRGLSLSS